MEKIFATIILAAAMIAAQSLRVDSVTVDSVWNSDSASRVSRDCIVSFLPVCSSGKADYNIELSVDSGKTFSTSLILMSPQISGNADCGAMQHVRLRVEGPDRPGVVVRVKAGWWSLPDTAALFVSTPATLKSNHYIPDLYFHFDYVDTLRTNPAVDSFIFLASTGKTTLSYNPGDMFCIVRWTYDSAPPDYDSCYHAIAPDGKIHTSVVAVSGDKRDTLTWDVRVNTFPWLETSQYQVQTTVYRGNTYADTVIVSDVDGDKPAFTVTDTGNFGVHIVNVQQAGDTTYCAIAWTVAKTGMFGVVISVIDSVNGAVGYDTTLALTFKAQEKTLITSKPQFMTCGTPVDSVYRDTIDIFPDFLSSYSGQLVRGPSGMTLTGNVISWTPAAAVEETVVVAMSAPSYAKGSDTLTWVVRAVTSSNYVFWYNAAAYGNTIHDNPGPNLPTDITLFQGVTAAWRTCLLDKRNMADHFIFGNGSAIAWGRSAMAYFTDLCDKQGTVIKAVLRAEFRDGWGAYPNNAFIEPGEMHVKIGVIDLTVYRDLPVPNGYGGAIACSSSYRGGCPACANDWDYNMKFYYHPVTKVTIPGLMAEEMVTLQAPAGRPRADEPSVLDRQFYEIDVTEQVQWILNQKGRDYVTPAAAGDYAIVFLVPADWAAGGYGCINLYASSCINSATGSDTPWTQDGNTLHLYVEGEISPAP